MDKKKVVDIIKKAVLGILGVIVIFNFVVNLYTLNFLKKQHIFNIGVVSFIKYQEQANKFFRFMLTGGGREESEEFH